MKEVGRPDDFPRLVQLMPSLDPARAARRLSDMSRASALRVVELMTLMTIGLYNRPAGSYLPSVLD